ncbi:hypothetical protein EAD89_03585 [Micromonospora sp. BL4]|uniref:hypothetical protein n=1 Tax=Micromonospora sp. BL4 TaxID=2478710 RepID=UPI000EF5F33B|nr:hypothetical protein [Micromonospora sp. BL4]RLP94728.1 hypothetical protein EAD89_03585 [Micromonospora sp. BL4]
METLATGAIVDTAAVGKRWPAFAAVWVGAYAVVHAWWAVQGAPRFAEPGESFFPGGWLPVATAVLSTAAVLLIDWGAGLTTYFGIGGMTAWATGNNMDGAAWFLVIVLPAYTLWGLGLLVAATSYLSRTRPECALHRASH